jgi:glycosyltransferase involved in cell wall biosynthesis
MRVLIQNRPDAFDISGGDTVQMMKTAQYLKKLGVDVDISLEPTPDLSNYDIVHLMNITRVTFTYTQLKNAKKQRKKVVLSPIYWNTREVVISYILQTASCIKDIYSLKELGSVCLRSLANRTFLTQAEELLFSKKMALTVLANVDCILPNSRAELEILKHDFPDVFKKRKVKATIVPNGVDEEIFSKSSPEPFIRKYGISDFILNVGRFSFRKNQFSLIRALKGTGLTVVFIGESARSADYYAIKDIIDKLYYQQCKKEADASFKFLGSMPHEKLASAYAACKVFVLPSLYETPGLSALEAALAGANICITAEGATREYFSNFAFYCNPHSISSIRNAVLQAYNAPKNDKLKEHILKNFTWKHTAEATLKAYEKVLDENL